MRIDATPKNVLATYLASLIASLVECLSPFSLVIFCNMSRTEKLYVLYGSQMGNSEGAAKEFCGLIQSTYNDDFFQKHNLPIFKVEMECIQLDDFLEVKHADYTKCLVIFVSSYGVGGGTCEVISLSSLGVQ